MICQTLQDPKQLDSQVPEKPETKINISLKDCVVNWLGSFKEGHCLKYIRRKICLQGFSTTRETAKNLDFSWRKNGVRGGNYPQIEATWSARTVLRRVLLQCPAGINCPVRHCSVPSFQIACTRLGVERMVAKQVNGSRRGFLPLLTASGQDLTGSHRQEHILQRYCPYHSSCKRWTQETLGWKGLGPTCFLSIPMVH